MTNIIPGAIWTPIDVGRRAARRRGRAYVSHISVSNQVNLMPGPLATRGADWHLFLPKDPQPGGRFFQQIDLDLQSWSTYMGNGSVVASEAQGGVGDDVGGPWSDNQIESQAIILAYLNETEDVPISDMMNSLPGSRGYGVHRYGIDPYRVAGGELWTKSYGKACPGDLRVRQIPVVVSRAYEIRHGSPSPTPMPTPQPAPLPPAPMPGTFGWNLPSGHYYGNIAGPAVSHGGYYVQERDEVAKIQQWFIWLGCVSEVPSRHWETSGWDDGRWENATDAACVRFHQRFYPNQPYMDRIYADDLSRLFQSRP